MPIYEYRCRRCGAECAYLLLRASEAAGLRCRRCGSRRLERILSPVRLHKTEQQRLAEFDPSRPRDEAFYRDDRNIGLWAKKRAQQLGVDLGSEFDAAVERARSRKWLED